MKVKDIFSWWWTERDPIVKCLSKNLEFVIANRPPSEKDPIRFMWWYDRSSKTMYKLGEKGYEKD